jgi:preprotein translocase subunit SecG
MIILFFILIVLAAIALGFLVLIQNPKGGGLSGSIGGFSNQFMGVKKTKDVLEKGTWIFASIIGVLCIFSSLFIKTTGTTTTLPDVNTTQQASPAPAQTAPNTVALPDSGKK